MKVENHSEHQNLDFNKITQNIYIGTNMCCQTHFDENLLKKGITEDISLEEESIDTPFGVNSYLWLPTKDHTPPSEDQIDIGVSALEKLISLNKKVYVHCKNGHGRAPTLVAAYFIETKGVNAEEAVALIKKERPTMHLDLSQEKALEELHKTTSSNRD